MTPRVRRALSVANKIANASGSAWVGLEHLFLAVLEAPDGPTVTMLEKAGYSREELIRELTAAPVKRKKRKKH